MTLTIKAANGYYLAKKPVLTYDAEICEDYDDSDWDATTGVLKVTFTITLVTTDPSAG